jgi:hypothetical protein
VRGAAIMAAPRRPCPPRLSNFGPHFVFRRVLHTDTAVGELRALLTNEWATLSVVAGLFVLLSGTASVNSPAALGRDADLVSRYVFVGANTFAYIGGASSCLVSLFLLHASNTVPAPRLHDFLVRSHSLLWVPIGGIVLAVVCTSVSNWMATLIIYGSNVAFGVRVAVAVLWLALLGAAVTSISHSAAMAAGPRAAERAEAEAAAV